jgi:hypothetical protein
MATAQQHLTVLAPQARATGLVVAVPAAGPAKARIAVAAPAKQ